MLNILVTGANGQLGHEMQRLGAISPNNYHFTDIAELDITDAAAVLETAQQLKVDAIVNCAAYTNVEKAEEDEATADKINRQAVAALAAAAKAVGAALLHVSTDYVFDGSANTPLTEQMPTSPIGVYGRTKLAGEEEIITSGCRYLIFRTAWLYSEFGNNFLKTMLKLTAEREEVKVVSDQIGTPTYAGDLALAIFAILEDEAFRTQQGVFHFSDEGVCSWYDFAYEIAREAGHNQCRVIPCHTSEFPTKAQRPAYSVLDKTKIKETFGIEIPHWRDSMCYCLKKMM